MFLKIYKKGLESNVSCAVSTFGITDAMLCMYVLPLNNNEILKTNSTDRINYILIKMRINIVVEI